MNTYYDWPCFLICLLDSFLPSSIMKLRFLQGDMIMARVTVEDCVERIPNRFELVVLAAQRARELSSGALPKVARDNDKNPVISLREISEEAVTSEDLRARYVASIKAQQCGFASQISREAELRQAMKEESTTHLLDNFFTDTFVAASTPSTEELGEV